MTRTSPKGTASAKPVTVAICEGQDEDKFGLLDKTLKESDFWKILESTRRSSRTPRKKFRILIKPNLEFFDVPSSTGTDPQLVEHLIDLFFEHGFETIRVADALGSADAWLENRDVVILADLAGYRFVTDAGHSYDVLNLSEDLVNTSFPDDSVLHGSKMSTFWLEAQFRIGIAKNKTDEENRYSLGLQNLAGVLPMREKEYHYRNRLDLPEVCCDLLQHAGVHFSIIDAFVSNHGNEGFRRANPVSTRTMIGSSDLLLADWAGALKMGLDPYTSPLNAKALREIGLPPKYEITGNLTPYPSWKNVSLLLSDSVRKRNESAAINRMARAWLQSVNTELFPFRNVMDEQINSILTRFLSGVDEHPLIYWTTIGLNYMLTGVQKTLESWKVLYDKDKLYRQDRSLGIDLEAYTEEDYDAVIDYITQLAVIVRHTSQDQNGLRWRYIDNSVLFEFTRILPVPYKDFVDRVPINRAVQVMYDNLGGASVPVSVDEQNRVVRQAERDIYLPQPNWMVLFGGKTIDVGKIETIRYGQNRQEIFWRTVTSENDSAEFDDGMVSFAKHKSGTMVTIVARQKFALPLIWQAINLEFIPEIKDLLVSNAYVTFFSRTMANYEAVYEDRDTRTGRDWDRLFGENGEEMESLITKQVSDIFSAFSGVFEQLARKDQNGLSHENVLPDEMGYRHFVGKSSSTDQDNPLTSLVTDFFTDVGEALRKDVQLVNKPKKQGDS